MIATTISAASGDDASATAAMGKDIAYPRSRQNLTTPMTGLECFAGAWSAAAAVCTGYIKPVNKPSNTPARTR